MNSASAGFRCGSAHENGMSTYVPSWVKRDTERFPRAHLATVPIQHISPFGEAIAQSDGSAFARFMGYLRDSGRADWCPLCRLKMKWDCSGDLVT